MVVEDNPEATCLAGQRLQLRRNVSEKCQCIVMPILEAPRVRPDRLMMGNAIAERIERHDKLTKILHIILRASPGSVRKPLPDGLTQFRLPVLGQQESPEREVQFGDRMIHCERVIALARRLFFCAFSQLR